MNALASGLTGEHVLKPGESCTIALLAEHLSIDTRIVETGRVNVSTRVVSTEQVVDIPLLRDDVEIERIICNQPAEQALPIREENGVTIISVYEEKLIVVKQLILKEEVHIRRRKSVQDALPQHFTLRHEEASISRSPADVRPEQIAGP